MTSYALDADTVSYILREKANVCAQMQEAVAQGDSIHIPPYAYYEVQRWLSLKKAAKKQKVFDRLYEKTGISSLDRVVFDQAVSIYTDLTPKGIVIDDGDILIAAFCMVNDYVLVTNNMEHYKNIRGLRLVNWNS